MGSVTARAGKWRIARCPRPRPGKVSPGSRGLRSPRAQPCCLIPDPAGCDNPGACCPPSCCLPRAAGPASGWPGGLMEAVASGPAQPGECCWQLWKSEGTPEGGTSSSGDQAGMLRAADFCLWAEFPWILCSIAGLQQWLSWAVGVRKVKCLLFSQNHLNAECGGLFFPELNHTKVLLFLKKCSPIRQAPSSTVPLLALPQSPVLCTPLKHIHAVLQCHHALHKGNHCFSSRNKD